MGNAPRAQVKRPDIFRYHDYRAFLRDWIQYRKATRLGFTMKILSEEAKLANGCLPMVLSGRRSLTLSTFEKLLPHLHLNHSEGKYFENLVRLGSSESSSRAQAVAFGRMSKSAFYRRRNPVEAEFFIYMSHWYYIAIREMASLPGFRLEPEWIQKRLNAKIPLRDIKAAIEFLVEHRYLRVEDDGTIAPPKADLDCKGEVFRAALTQYHRQMFGLAADSIETVRPQDRNIEGFTIAMSRERFETASKILSQAMDQISALGHASDGKVADSVYHLEFALFPVTQTGGEDES